MLFRRYSGPQRMNQRCMDQTGPVVFHTNTYSESYKGKHTWFFQRKLRKFGKKLKRDHPNCISKAPKNKHRPRAFHLTKNRFQNKKMKRFHKGNHFRLERNGTFFLLFHRFFKLPDLQFALHGRNLTNIFLEKDSEKKQKQNLQPRKKSKNSRRKLSNGQQVYLLGFAIMRAFEEALHALKHIKSFQNN